MPKIVKYQIISYSNYDLVTQDVNQALGEGWEIFGSLVISSYVSATGESWTTYAQAMVQWEASK